MSLQIQLSKRNAVHQGRRKEPDRSISQKSGAVHDERIDIDIALFFDKGKDQDDAHYFDKGIAQDDLAKLLKSLKKPGNVDGAGKDLDDQHQIQGLVLGPRQKFNEEQEDRCRARHQQKPQDSELPEDPGDHFAVVSESRDPELPVRGDPQVSDQGKISRDGRCIAEGTDFPRSQDPCYVRLDHERYDHRQHLIGQVIYVVFLYTRF